MDGYHSSFFCPFVLLFLTLLSLVPIANCIPYGSGIVAVQAYNASSSGNSYLSGSFGKMDLQKKDDKPFELRILPLGASITWGLLSESGNGYRKPLRDQLRFDGWEVNMVGSKTHGSMKDNECEAHSGDVIDQVKAAAQKSLPYRPNVVLINAGTNDCRLNTDIPNTGKRMRSLIESLISADGMEKTTIVLSTLIPSNENETAANRPGVNDQYRDLVKAMHKEGVNIVLADMDPSAPAGASGWISWPDDYTHDGKTDDTHPNDYGYSKMARIWYNAIKDAYDQDLLEEPGVMASATCEKEYGHGVYAGGLTQRGSGEDDGIYYHSSDSMGVIFERTSPKSDMSWIFTRLLNSDRDDLLLWHELDDKVVYTMWRNTGNENARFEQLSGFLSVDDDCIPPGVNFIDINADGLDDFVCIAKDGTAYASINNGDGNDVHPPTFTSIGKWKDGEPGYDQAHVRLADIDGDGRGDYCVLDPNGDITCWRNGWIMDVPEYWQPLGKTFTGKGMGALEGVRFADINGDGRDDWVWVDDDGATTTWTNSRSCIKGEEGDGLNIVWRQGFQKGHNSGPTHSGMGGFPAKRVDQQTISFARIFGDSQDLGLVSRRDYVFLEGFSSGKGEFTYRFHAWKNTGYGGTKVKSDGNRYCNMMGHENGMMDYVWILSKGDMRIYPNKGMTDVSDDGESFWGPNYVIFDPLSMEIGKDLDRRDLHLVDWDGDGTCDIVWTDPDNENHVSLWRNRIKESDDFNWEYHSNPASTLYCPEKRGLGLFDIPVHFADITGNGKADYLCVEKDGRAWGWVQTDDGTWEYIDQFKFAEGKDRANLQWADVDGDGKADMIHTDKFNGDGRVWYNKGRKDIKGSRFEWELVGPKFQGAVQGSCTYFPDLDGNGRADMHSIIHSIDNTANTWFSRCGREDATGDDGPLEDPQLPVIPLSNVVVQFADNSCDDTRKALIREEISYAVEMAEAAHADVQKGVYYQTFFSGMNRKGNFAANTAETFRRSASMLSGTDENYEFKVTCHPTTEGCSRPRNWIAHMNDKTKTLNLCNRFFEEPLIHNTKDLLDDCQMDLRQAQRARSAVFIHESTHTKYVMRGEKRTKDFAYGFNSCYLLPLGNFDRSCAPFRYEGEKPKCPNRAGEESVCFGTYSASNADSYAFVAAGIYFSNKCGHDIPLPPLPDAATNDKKDLLERASCPSFDDAIPIDGGDSDIEGYVHFGDSYAAGMGTGTTSTDKCRVGSNNYGDLLYKWFADKSIHFEKHVCSGDTLTGLNTQIDNWQHPELTDVATLSIGGNDVGFSDMVNYCILTPNTFHFASTNRQYCLDAEKKARDYMEKEGDGGLIYRLKEAYLKILKKSKRDDFRLYVTTYPYFFNHLTTDCGQSSFHYFWGGYKPAYDPRIIMLTHDLRFEIYDLVVEMNSVIEHAVNAANEEWEGEKVHVADGGGWMDAHTWCQEGVHEPDSSVQSTYLFLSAWPDFPIGSSAAESSEPAELKALMDSGSIQLPNADTCWDKLGTDPDPYAVAMCRRAQEIRDDPDGPQAQLLKQANEAISSQDYNAQEISWWYPTRQIKSFHPRSMGMLKYRDAVAYEMNFAEHDSALARSK